MNPLTSKTVIHFSIKNIYSLRSLNWIVYWQHRAAPLLWEQWAQTAVDTISTHRQTPHWPGSAHIFGAEPQTLETPQSPWTPTRGAAAPSNPVHPAPSRHDLHFLAHSALWLIQSTWRGGAVPVALGARCAASEMTVAPQCLQWDWLWVVIGGEDRGWDPGVSTQSPKCPEWAVNPGSTTDYLSHRRCSMLSQIERHKANERLKGCHVVMFPSC